MAYAGRFFYGQWHTNRELALQNLLEASYEAEDWKQVESRARNLVDLYPQSAKGWLCLADAHREHGDEEQAAECLVRVPESDSRAIKALELASEIYFTGLNRPLDGISVCRDIIRISRRNAHARRRLIFFYALTLQRAELVRIVRESVSLRCEPPEAYVYLMLSDHLSFTNGYQLNTKWMQSDVESELFLVARAIQMSNSLSTLDDPDIESDEERQERHKLMEDYFRQYPQNPAILRYFVRKEVIAENVSAVGELLAKVPAEAADDPVLWRYRGWYHFATDDIDLARNAYQRSLELHPLDWQSWHGLAATTRKAGSLAEAARFQAIAVTGKELRKDLMQIEDARSVDPSLLARTASYARQCSDDQIADALDARLWLMR